MWCEKLQITLADNSAIQQTGKGEEPFRVEEKQSLKNGWKTKTWHLGMLRNMNQLFALLNIKNEMLNPLSALKKLQHCVLCSLLFTLTSTKKKWCETSREWLDGLSILIMLYYKSDLKHCMPVCWIYINIIKNAHIYMIPGHFCADTVYC